MDLRTQTHPQAYRLSYPPPAPLPGRRTAVVAGGIAAAALTMLIIYFSLVFAALGAI
ncbi:MAG: hypothetical protein H0W01_16700 [Pseudonocardiales bacterium]|jgi:hypothetical protein|nr:hypothetical protein [Pseudonocardiales bacterium]